MGANIGSPIDNRPTGRMYLTGAQDNLADGLLVLVNLDTIDPDFHDGIEDTVNHRINITRPGFYRIYGSICFGDLATGKSFDACLDVNDITTLSYGSSWYSGPGAGNVYVPVSVEAYLSAGDYIQLSARSNKGDATADLVPGKDYTFLEVQRVR